MRSPAAFKPLWVLGQKYPTEPMMLTFSPERGFIEPITNRDAEPVIGPILGWCYRGETDVEDKAIFESLSAHGVGSPCIQAANRSVPNDATSAELKIDREDPVEIVPEDGSRRRNGS